MIYKVIPIVSIFTSLLFSQDTLQKVSIHEIRTRFEVLHRDKTIEALNKKLAGEDSKKVDIWLEKEQNQLQEDFAFLAKANLGSEFMRDEDIARIEDIANKTWRRNFDDTLGLAHEEKQRVLQENSTTSQAEKNFEQLPFPEYLKNVPLYADSHHETLIGTGYPKQLTKEDMPIFSNRLNDAISIC